MSSHREQFIWQRTAKLAVKCYEITKKFPKEELYGLTNQLRRAAVSVPANIAEGYGRTTTTDYVRFLHIAEGSLREVDTHVWIATELGYINQQDSDVLCQEIDECLRLLLSAARKLASRT